MGRITGQAGDRAAHPLDSGAVDRLVVNHRRFSVPRRVCAKGVKSAMSYRVLARTYRSETFDELVGQEHVATTLTNAIRSGRVHHGYLFTGTRGVGKTLMARILAKSLNCLSFDEATTNPCCQCDSCSAISIGEDVDVVEIDAASHTGVDNIRELRSHATLRPARARYKIYIIDEVHMLSTGAFNALLKTLEEPPSHVKFILATTEAHKVPATIQSRCQRFDFRAIDAQAIAAHLQSVLEKEHVEADEAVLRRIARLAQGSMRDGLSLLDMLLSYGADRLSTDLVDELIPPLHDELAAAVNNAVAKNDAAAALLALDHALQSGRTVERLCDHLVEYVRTLMLLRVCGEDTDLADVAGTVRAELAKQSQAFDAPTYVYMIGLLEELRRSVKFSGAARALADAAVVRLAMSEQFTDINNLLDRLGDSSSGALADSPKKKALDAERNTPSVKPPGESAATPRASAPSSRVAEHISSSDTLSVADAQAALRRTVDRGDAPNPKPIHARSPRSAQWDKVAADPLVVRVKEAVEGTLKDVRRIQPTSEPTTGNDLNDERKGQETDSETIVTE